MNSRAVAIFAILVFAVGIIVVVNSVRSQRAEQTVQKESTSNEESLKDAENWSVAVKKDILITLDPQQNSTESGTAQLSEVDGKVIVTLNLMGYPSSTPQPAHIHDGSCPNVGAIKYSLSDVINGKSETVLNTTLKQLMSELPLLVNIHKSQTESKIYSSCGDIR